MKKLTIILIAATLCGCIEVKDFGEFWAEAKVNPELIDYWRSTDGFTCEFTPSGKNLAMRETVPDEKAQKLAGRLIPPDGSSVRTLSYRGYEFLLVKNLAEDKGGQLRRYTLNQNSLTFLIFDDHILEQGIRSGAVHGTIPERIPYDSKTASVPHPLTALQGCTVSALTTDALEFLASAANAKHWRERTYTRHRKNETAVPSSEPKP